MFSSRTRQAGGLTKNALIILLLAAIGCSSPLVKVSEKILSENTGRKVVAFTHVNVLSMVFDGVLEDQTLIVKDGMISSILPASRAEIPNNAFVIDSRGKYLLPGLIDMHVHVSDDEDLLLLIANGVTTVRNMADLPSWVKTLMGFSDILSLREEMKGGKIIGPDIYTCGLVLDGSPPVSPFNEEVNALEDIQEEIERQKKEGFDYIKIYDMLTPEAFNNILRVADSNALPVIGHVPFAVGIDKVLTSNVSSIEHLTGYINNNRADFIISPDSIGEYAKRTYKSGIYNCPTLVIWDKLPREAEYDSLRTYKEYRYLSWRIKWLWKQTLGTVYDIDSSLKSDYPIHMMKISKQMAKALYDEKCKLLVGTDMNFVGVFPGSSALREIELLVESGQTPLDALKAATVNAAECLGKQESFGTIAVGKRADLLLLDHNPIENIQNINSTFGVMVRGLWIDRNQILAILKELE